MDKEREKISKKKVAEEHEENEEEDEEQKEDQLGDDFIKDVRVLTYTSEAGKIADGKDKI